LHARRSNLEPFPMRRLGHPVGTIVAVLGAAVFLYLIRPILLVFIVPMIIAYVCAPWIDRLARRTRAPRWVVASGVFFVLTAAAALLGWLVAAQVSSGSVPSWQELQVSVTGLLQSMLGHQGIALPGHTLTPAQITSRIASAVEAWFQQDARLPQLLAAAVAGMFGLVLSWVLLAYFLVAGPQIAQGALQLVPPERRAFVARVYQRLDPILRRYFLGVLVVVIYASGAAYLGLGVLLGLHHAALLACITGLLETLPIIGPASSAVIGGVVAVREAVGASAIVAYIVYAFALRISIDQMIGPWVLGRAGRVSPVLVIFSFLSGGILYGIAGVILAVPVALAVKTTLAVLYEEHRVNVV